MYHSTEPLITLEVGPHFQEFEFLVDTGADCSSINRVPLGVMIGDKTCELVGAESRPFLAPVLEEVLIKGNSRTSQVDQVYLPDLDANLLGRDLQVQLGIGIIPQGGKMVVRMFKLTEVDLGEINQEVWVETGKYGKLDIPPLRVKMTEGPPIQVRQYPLSLENRRGLEPIIQSLLSEGILE